MSGCAPRVHISTPHTHISALHTYTSIPRALISTSHAFIPAPGILVSALRVLVFRAARPGLDSLLFCLDSGEKDPLVIVSLPGERERPVGQGNQIRIGCGTRVNENRLTPRHSPVI